MSWRSVQLNGLNRPFADCVYLVRLVCRPLNATLRRESTDNTVRHIGEDMQVISERNVMERAALRNPTKAAVTCRPFTSSGAIRISDGVMRNFSSLGSYVETSNKFTSGSVLIVRMVCYPSRPSTVLADEERPRSICLAEVRWQRELADETAMRFGMGLRYLE